MSALTCSELLTSLLVLTVTARAHGQVSQVADLNTGPNRTLSGSNGFEARA